MTTTNTYQNVFQSKSPNGKWNDVKTFQTDSSFFITPINAEEISKIRREYNQDLPKFQTRVVKRRVKI